MNNRNKYLMGVLLVMSVVSVQAAGRGPGKGGGPRHEGQKMQRQKGNLGESKQNRERIRIQDPAQHQEGNTIRNRKMQQEQNQPISPRYQMNN